MVVYLIGIGRIKLKYCNADYMDYTDYADLVLEHYGFALIICEIPARSCLVSGPDSGIFASLRQAGV